MGWQPDPGHHIPVTPHGKTGLTIRQRGVYDLQPRDYKTRSRDGKIRYADKAPDEMGACKLQDLMLEPVLSRGFRAPDPTD